MYYKKLLGDRIYLSPIDVNDAEKMLPWLNDFRVSDGAMISRNLFGLESEKAHVAKMATAENERNFSIVDLKSGKLIGNCGIKNIDHFNQNAELAIMIGEEDFRGKGLGAETLNLLLDFGFNYLNFHEIYLDVLANNIGAIKCYKKCGFIKTGVSRENEFVNGKFRDVVRMDILREEFGDREYIRNKFL